MQTIPRSPFVRIVVMPLTFFSLLSGCYKTGWVEGSPAAYVDEQKPDELRLLSRDRGEMTLRDPTLVDERVEGMYRDTLRRIPLEDVAGYYRREIKAAETALAVIGAAAAVTVGLALVAFDNSGGLWGDQ